jgi:hypothetical protein
MKKKERMLGSKLTNCFLERRRFVMNFLVRMVTALSAMISIKTLDFVFGFWRRRARDW